jgi:hypothetical protein
MTSLSSDEIRRLVREALREALPGAKADGGGQAVSIRIVNDDDLNAFAREIARADEAKREAIVAGRMRFTLGRKGGAVQTGGTERLDKGVLTEAMVVELGRTVSRVILGRCVAVTPLARDKAREVKLEIVRDKP